MKDQHYGRKRKGIKMQLDKVLESWLESIDDEATRLAVKRDTIVTGGSIASMLLGEPVNDYDIYFRTYETTLLVAKYYVAKFNTLKPDYLPAVNEENRDNAKGETEKRIVIFVESSGVAKENTDALKDDKKTPFRPVFLSENAITLSDKVQLVTRFYGEPDQIHDNYDFIHATCYYDFGNDDLVFPADAMEALLSRTLVYRGSLYPVASIFRAKKFIERGWRITAGQLLKIMWQISELDLSDFNVLREQLTGVDQTYMWLLVKALKDVEPDKINSDYVTTIIDKIFD